MTHSLDPKHQDLLQFLYQVPIGVVAMDEAGRVDQINPAAVRLLAPEIRDGESLESILPFLTRLVPGLVHRIVHDADHLGVIDDPRGHRVDGAGDSRFTISAHRLRRDRILLSLTDISEERRLLAEQRRRGARLQRALLGHVDATPHEVGVEYQPAHVGDLSGGDWYDVIRVDEHRYAYVVGDVVGHDIEASATMGQLRSVIRANATIDADPAVVMGRTEAFARAIRGARCATLAYVLYDAAAHKISYACAGHPPPLIVRADGRSEFLTDGRRPPLAAFDETAPTVAVASFRRGDTLVLYSDGLIERRGESLDRGLDRLGGLAATKTTTTSAADLARELLAAAIDDGAGDDDICVLTLRA
jgi:serine phosphatase RsbU (regulator of sigma subunit)